MRVIEHSGFISSLLLTVVEKIAGFKCLGCGMAQNTRILGPKEPRIAGISCGDTGRYRAAAWSISLPHAMSSISKTLLEVDLVNFLV